MWILNELTGAGYLDWEKTEEILNEFPEVKDAFIEACRDQICNCGYCDPVGTIYQIITENSDFSEMFRIFPNYLATSVDFVGDTKKLEGKELDSYTEFLLREAGVYV